MEICNCKCKGGGLQMVTLYLKGGLNVCDEI